MSPPDAGQGLAGIHQSAAHRKDTGQIKPNQQHQVGQQGHQQRGLKLEAPAQ